MAAKRKRRQRKGTMQVIELRICHCNIEDFPRWVSHNRTNLEALFCYERVAAEKVGNVPLGEDVLQAEFRAYCEIFRQSEAARLGIPVVPAFTRH